MIERQDIVSCSITFFLRNPFDLLGQINSILQLESLTFKMKYQFFTFSTQFSISEISLYRIKLAN